MYSHMFVYVQEHNIYSSAKITWNFNVDQINKKVKTLKNRKAWYIQNH